MFAFLALLFVLIVIFLFTSATPPSVGMLSGKEGFENTKDESNKDNFNKVTIPVVPTATSVLPDKEDNVSPHTLPGDLPHAPYDQIATMNPRPYQDTTQIKANRQQIVSLLENLKGFLSFEAQELDGRSDPTIQLPLSNARSDLQVLQNAVDLLNRNPGLQPTLSQTTLNEMSANLAFLQEQVRLTGSAGAIVKEGFEDANGSAKSKDVASVQDLTDFISRIQGEILRLSTSGTTDITTNKRVSALTELKNNVQGIINKVNSKSMNVTEIPVLKSDIDKAFPVNGHPSYPLPQIINSLKLPAGLANALPANLQKDPETTQQIGALLDKYADQIINGISATFSVTYTSPNEIQANAEQNANHSANSTVDKSGFPSIADLNNVSNSKFIPADSGVPVTDRLAPTPLDAGRGPSHFDWKQRTKEIESQVKKRGLKPSDFGIMPEGTKVSDDFSWKGYARMICNRLQATTDPALGVTCGCPPMDWKGWRIAK